ncbi:MAG: 5'-methylthioadenosine/adenosylhomocysteine nucleosidase [Ruminococcaceae bacterium]|nr:5'-methylthioadenosine/adenosylhomocysteine nucleosidase [Oscillospiraceae bacterium]
MSDIIGIIGAMDIEVDGIISNMTNTQFEEISSMKFVSGELYGKRIVVCKCGIGKVFAGICAQTMILKYAPKIIINSGVAGALDEKLCVLDSVVATSVVQHDMDTSPLGDPVGLISGINVVNIEADKKVSKALENSAKELQISVKRGTIASGDQFIANNEKKQYIKDTFSASACEMEGGAIAQACYVNKIPFAILRTISDGKGEVLDYFTFSERAAVQAIKIIKNFIKYYEV